MRAGACGLARYDRENRIRSTHINKLKYYYYCLLDAVSGGRLYHGRRMSKPGEWLFDLRDYSRRRP
jgi:hypothetical protein